MAKIIQNIRSSFDRLSPSKKKVASYFMNHYSTLYLSTVLELAEKIGVSDTTVINFCSDLGFAGYSDFKQAVREELTAGVPEEAPASADSSGDVTTLMLSCANRLSRDLTATLGDPDNKNAVNAAMKLLSEAKKIYLAGFYGKAAIAKSEATFLLYRGYEAEAIYPDLGDYIDHLLWAGPGSVAVVFDMALYSTGLTEICSVFKEKGIPVILITDMGPCPRLPMADVAIHCRVDVSAEGHPDKDVLCHALARFLFDALTTLHPRKSDDYNASLREGVFTRFNPYGVFETTKNTLSRI